MTSNITKQRVGFAVYVILMLLFSFFCAENSAYAYRFGILGSRSLGMGGTGTGFINDSTAIFWNPALTPKQGWNVILPFTLDFGDLENYSDFLDEFTDPAVLQGSLFTSGEKTSRFDEVLQEFGEEHMGSLMNINNGVFMTPRYLSVAVYSISRVYEYPVIDRYHVGRDPFKSDYILLNGTRTDSVGLETRVFAFSYSISLDDMLQMNFISRGEKPLFAPDIPGSGPFYGDITDDNFFFIDRRDHRKPFKSEFLFGINFNIFDATTHFVRYTAWQEVFDPRSEDELREIFLDSNKRSETDWGIDLGFYYRPASGKWAAGLAARSLNTPEFSFGYTDEHVGNIKLKRELRAGFTYNISDDWMIAADLDLTKNDTGLPSYSERILAIGTEKSIMDNQLLLRGGFQKNLSESESPVLTMGGGTHFNRFTLDAGFGFNTAADRFLFSATLGIKLN